jgi:hypothetical protein
LPVSIVQQMWRALGLQAHRLETFKFSIDPEIVAKIRDVFGLYIPPTGNSARPGDYLRCFQTLHDAIDDVVDHVELVVVLAARTSTSLEVGRWSGGSSAMVSDDAHANRRKRGAQCICELICRPAELSISRRIVKHDVARADHQIHALRSIPDLMCGSSCETTFSNARGSALSVNCRRLLDLIGRRQRRPQYLRFWRPEPV